MGQNRHLRQTREAQGWSQAQLSQHLETSVMTVWRWEQGYTHPGLYYRKKLCDVFQKTPQELGLISETPVETSEVIVPNTSDSPYPNTLNIPLVAHSLVGRDALLHSIIDQLNNSAPCTIACYGLPGVGKTALMAEVIRQPAIQPALFDGILWAGLGLSPQTEAILNSWGKQLGWSNFPVSDRLTIQRRIQASIGIRRFLFVIDDAWQLEDALALKVGGPHCSYLLTTRFATLAIQFAPMNTMLVPELGMHDSTELFNRWLPEKAIVGLEQIQELVRKVGGLPLAISLMGNYVQQYAISKQPRRIQKALADLQSAATRFHLTAPISPTERPPHVPAQLSLQTIISVSCDIVSPSARHVLGVLALFPAKPNQFTEAAASDVSGLAQDEFFAALDELVDAGLVEPTGPERYCLHQTIAEYAELMIPLNKSIVIQLFIAYYIQYVNQHQHAYSELDAETTNIHAAFAAADTRQRIQILITWRHYLLGRGIYTFAYQAYQQTYTEAKEQNITENLDILLYQLIQLASVLGFYPQSETYAWQGRKLALQWKHTALACRILQIIGVILMKQGQVEQAEISLRQALEEAEQLPERAPRIRILTSLGTLCVDKGEYPTAHEYVMQGLEEARELGDGEQIAACLQMLGLLAGLTGDAVLAMQYTREGLTISRQLGTHERTCSLLTNLGAGAIDQGQYTESLVYLYEAEGLARRINHPERLCGVLANLAEATSALEDLDQAKHYSLEGITIARVLNHIEKLLSQLHISAYICRKQHLYAEAEQHILEGEALSQQVKNYKRYCQFLYEKGMLYLEYHKDMKMASQYFQKAYDMAQTTRHKQVEVASLYELGRIEDT